MDIKRDRDIDLNNIYAWNYNLLKFMGIWPEERKWNRSSSYLVLFPFLTMVCFACGPQTINLSIIAGDSDLVIENLSNNITFMVSIMKTLTVWINGIPLKSLLGYMANDWDAVTNNIERETMVNTARITRKITIGSTLMVNIVILAFVPARLSSMKNNDITLFLRGYYPYNTSISPNFELTMIAQYVAAIYAANTYTTVDTLVVLLIFHVCGQLAILRQDLRKIHSYDKKNIEMKMQKIVEKHEYINRFAGRIENSFNMMLLFQMLSCTIQICSQFYQVIMSLGENTMEDMILQISFLLIYVAYVMLQLFLYCYMGEKLAAESTEIANIAYSTKWYNLPPKNARWLVIIMCRARSSPLQITAGRFCSFTFALYCQVSVNELLLCTIFSEMKMIFDLLTGLLHVFLCHMMRFVETMGLKSCMSLSFLERYCKYKQTIYAIILVIGNCKTFPWLFFPTT
ncbi:odorant receptor 4-like isoform X1 [Bombus affinis]|uniref:odorant receptor 4-like isoform X1 n=1 Tax=Bombus affinis TaxID=309941 RepID=UPI0021B75FB7|nr:odorant receptor 4-like isoform X1 [Bombus affinis]XP_050587355.1 odorant receptor 4-like isoform X1 [Bombus affinis]